VYGAWEEHEDTEDDGVRKRYWGSSGGAESTIVIDARPTVADSNRHLYHSEIKGVYIEAPKPHFKRTEFLS